MPAVDVTALALELESTSPRAIVQRALTEFGEHVAISFSGAEDVLLIEYARQLDLPFKVFTIDTGRLHPETLRFIAEVEKHYAIRIQVCMPEAGPVEAMVRQKGLFSFYEDGHQQCCGLRKVAPLRQHLSGLMAWVTGQRRDQSPGTRSRVPVVEVDSSHVGANGQPLIKWNPLATCSSAEVWDALRAFEVPVNELHSRGFVSIGCEPCTRSIQPGEHERAGRWWWEEETKRECGLHRSPASDADS